MATPKTKLCPKCSTRKSRRDFPKNRAKKDGLGSYCKLCQRAYIRGHYRSNKSYYVAKARGQRIKMGALIAKLKDRPCVDCGRSFPHVAMDFHHAEDSEKEDCVTRLASNGASRKRVMEEVAKCAVLCACCHRIRHFMPE